MSTPVPATPVLPPITVKFVKLSTDAVTPSQGNPTDSGYDVVAVDDGVWSDDGRYIEYNTGIAIEMPAGYHAKAAPRSSNSKFDLILCNGEGLLDNAYRGAIKLRFKYVPPFLDINAWNAGTDHKVVRRDLVDKLYKKGDKIAQLYFEKVVYATFTEVTELSTTARADGGFGSTGR